MKHEFDVVRVLCLGIVLALSPISHSGAARAETSNEAKKKPRLLYLLLDSHAPGGESGPIFDRLTVQGYREHGVTVIEVSHSELTDWLEKDGKDFAKAHENFQYLALAKARGADAVGGLKIWEIAPDQAADWQREPGTYIFPWGISLNGCSHNFILDLNIIAKPKALPLKLQDPFDIEGKSDPWAIPLSVEPKACDPRGRTVPDWFTPDKRRPFIGITMKSNRVSSVYPESPAEEAEVVAGDTILTFNGKKVSEISDLHDAINWLSPGTEADLEYQHQDIVVKKHIKLADYHEAVEKKLSWEGKSLPDIKGVDIDGHEVRLSELKGKIVLLDFWATWCGPCLEELPLAQLLWERAKDKGFVWVAVSVDEDEDAWRAFVKSNRLGGIQMRDPDAAIKLYISGFPTILVVDRTGVVQCNVRGDAIAKSVMALLEQH
ncbi:MAG: redoxin domain-containing protein [Planctomycetes bacterium]|nr:redoxin domain-containing protein [Planctomycetota bacterium]MBI3836154.1 redoxin domain-containing protein [Planctomycetota bacterium]